MVVPVLILTCQDDIRNGLGSVFGSSVLCQRRDSEGRIQVGSGDDDLSQDEQEEGEGEIDDQVIRISIGYLKL